MHQHLERPVGALRVFVALAFVAAAASAQSPPTPQTYPPAPQTYVQQPNAPQNYPAPQLYAPPFAYTYSEPAYGGAYVLPPVAGTPPDRNRGQLQPGEHRFSMLLSIVHPLVFSIYDASGEFRLARQAGLALVAGVGSASLKQFYKSLPDERARVWGGGMQVRFYPVGTFGPGLPLRGRDIFFTGSTADTGTINSRAQPSNSLT